MEPVLLFRKSLASKYELRFAEKYFRVEESRVLCANTLVIGRYAAYPFYDEVDRDLRHIGSRLINTVAEHQWISTFDYYRALKEFTPETWDDDNIHTCLHRGPFVVKGKLSSKKHHWQTQMFAETKPQALALGTRLKEDSDIREQGVVYRQYIPLKTYEKGHNGLPYTNEWRFFFLGDRLLSYGYYWSLADCVLQAELKPAALELAEHIAKIAAQHTTLYTLDIAETATGEWILIEINDCQMEVH
jgi:hypothetical protein